MNMLCPHYEVRDPEGTLCNPDEAPAGFYAVLKPASSATGPNSRNLCEQCEWRKQCNDPATDLLAYGHRCMSYAVAATRDGQTYRRKDKCSVLFKRIQS